MKWLSTLMLLSTLAGCITPPPAPPAPYHAVGTQPGWTLLIDSHDLTFIPADGQNMVRQPTPPPIIGIAGEIYQTPRIHVNIVHAECRDGESDRIYPDRVQVDVNGRRFNGCGGL